MGLVSGLAVYFIVWWLVFIAVLPFGVRTLQETGEIEPGQAPSAPSRPLIARKIVAASLVAGIVWAGLYALVEYAGLTLDDIPYGRPPGR